MGQILVWKCEHDGKLFEFKEKYLAHLRKLARERALERKLQKLKDDRHAFILGMANTVTTFDELSDFIKENWKFFFLNGVEENRWRLTKKKVDMHELEFVNFERMRWDDSVSNSHSCPRDGVENWGGMNFLKDGTPAPRGYPGWQGTINIGVRTPKYKSGKKEYYHDGFGSDYFDKTGIHTGTGGGGGVKDGITRYSYEVRLYASDWPAMAEKRNKSNNWKAVGGKTLEGVI